MSLLAQAISAALIHSVWQDALIATLLWITLVALRRRSAAIRYVVSCAALAALVAVPAATAGAFVLRAAAVDVGMLPTVATIRALVAPQPMLSIWMRPEPSSATWLAEVQTSALPLWSLGVLACSVRLACAWVHVFILGRRGEPADERLLAMVRTVGRRLGIGRPVRVLISALADGPSIVGWLRPIMLLTPAMVMGLTPLELEALVAHELAHVKRWDYLVNLCQIVAETLFFYHPAIWWASGRIRVERELCCDDLAVRSCGDPLCYARALTALEKQRASAPALAMAGTGGPLLYRIQRLLGLSPQEAGLSRWPFALALAVVAASATVNLDWTRLLAQEAGASPQFEAASIKTHSGADRRFALMGQGNRFTATNVTARALIRNAYQLQDDQLVGGPAWLGADHFDIEATAEGPFQTQLRLRALLADRFALVMHKETRELPVYALLMARNDKAPGPRLRPSAVDCAARGQGAAAGPSATARGGSPVTGAGSAPTLMPAGDRPRCGMRLGPGTMTAVGNRLTQLATELSSWVNRIVVDRTGLTGGYDMDLQWTPDQPFAFGLGEPAPAAPAGTPAVTSADPDRPSIFTALQEQLGLRLDPQRGPVEVLVVDRIDHPTDD